jgi:hypothetical protein
MKNYLLFLFLSFSLSVSAEGVEVTATVDRNQVGPGDVISLTVAVTAQNSVQVEEPHLPPLSGFELINTSSGMETRSSFVNGSFQTTQSRNFNYMLAVQQKGVLTIPSINVQVEGKSYKTQPIKVSATNARAAAPQGQNQDAFQQMDEMEEMFNQMLQRRLGPHAAPGAQGSPDQPPINPDEAFFILAQTDKTKVYVGEQITANFYLYTRGQIRDIDTLKYPDLKGFWKEELEMATRLNMEQAVINGVAYQRALLVSYALFPIKAGKSVIDPYKAKCTVLTPSSFGFGHPYVFTKASKAIPIEVMEVPTVGRPANFSGAVGHFHVSAQFEPPTGVTNQPITLRVRFEGQGNAKLIELPKLDLPPSFEFYETKSDAKFMKDGTSYKEFDVMIIPREPGVFNINPVSASVFDPTSGKFTAIASQALHLSVTGSATTPAAPSLPSASGTSDKTAAVAEPSLPGLATELEMAPLSVMDKIWVTAAIYLLLALGLLLLARQKLRRKAKRVSLSLALKKRLLSIRKLAAAGDWRRVGVELTNATYYVLGQISDQGGSSLELNLMLEHTPPSLRSELSQPLQNLLQKCEMLSFAPENLVGSLTEKANLEALIKEFESVMNRAIVLAEL